MNTFDEISKILTQVLGVEHKLITPEAAIRESLGADSLDEVEIVIALEDFFNISVDDEQAADWLIVSDIDRYVKTAIADRELQGAEA